MQAPSLKIVNLHKAFGDNKVLNGITTEIYPSKINFIIGQSGGGKSVLLKHLVGLLKPDKGEIWYNNFNLLTITKNKWLNVRKEMGLLFQSGALFDSMNIGENVAFPLMANNTKSNTVAFKMAQERLNELNLADCFYKMPADLSTGEIKRAALARALILEPKILFFDEPTTGLDPLLSEQVDNLIVETGEKTGATIVVISHDIAATLSIADNISMIHNGQIVLSGTPLEFKNSNNPAVKQFLNAETEGPINFID